MQSTLPSHALYGRLLAYVRPYWRVFALCLVAIIFYAATDPVLPALLKPFLDGGFLTSPSWQARLFPLLIVLLFLLRGGLNFVSTVSLAWVAQRVMADLRHAMFERLVYLPAQYYDSATSGELLSRLTYNVTQVEQAVTRVLMVLCKDTLSAIALLAYMAWLEWRLTLVVLVLAPLIAYAVNRISARLREMSRRLQQSMGNINAVAEEAISGHKVVKIFGGHDYEVGRFRQTINNARKYAMKVVMAAAANEPIVLFIVASGIAIAIYAARIIAATQGMTTGEFVSFFAAALILQAPARRLTGINEPLQRGLAAAESIFALIDTAPEEDTGTVALGRARGDIEFRDVSFGYPQAPQPALRNISFTVRAGETVALVGASGSGKSTLASLVPRFHRPTSGAICIDGVNINDVTLASLRKCIALVTQDVVLFNDTIRNNIAYGSLRGVPEAAVLQAAEAARVMEFVREMPEGLDTLIGENGVRLSGGQRQRLAIARALLKDAPILILDEATSALDTASERHIQAALETLRQGRTSLVIAHRLSTIENADRIVVLQKGSVVETGTHAELLKRDRVYANLHRSQFVDAASETVSLE
jgi:subfamily B ATP-binding cassette protein MsbA